MMKWWETLLQVAGYKLRVCETKSVGCSVKGAENKDKGMSTIGTNFPSSIQEHGKNVGIGADHRQAIG
jgi:hypothetical protein